MAYLDGSGYDPSSNSGGSLLGGSQIGSGLPQFSNSILPYLYLASAGLQSSGASPFPVTRGAALGQTLGGLASGLQAQNEAALRQAQTQGLLTQNQLAGLTLKGYQDLQHLNMGGPPTAAAATGAALLRGDQTGLPSGAASGAPAPLLAPNMPAGPAAAAKSTMTNPLAAVASQTEKDYSLPPGMVFGLLTAENSGANAVSPKGATGVGQFMPATAQQYGIDPTKTVQSVDAMGRMSRDLLQKYKDPRLVAMAYDWGSGNLDKWLASGANWNDVPQETRNYVANFSSALAQSGANGSAAANSGAVGLYNPAAANSPAGRAAVSAAPGNASYSGQETAAAPQGGNARLFDLARQMQQFQIAVRTPGMQQVAAQILAEINRGLPTGYYVGQDGQFHIDPNYVQGQGQVTGAQEWAKVAPTLYEKEREPYTLERPGATRIQNGQVVAQNPLALKGVNSEGTPFETYVLPPVGGPGGSILNPGAGSGGAPDFSRARLPGQQLQYPNNPQSVFNQPVGGGAPAGAGTAQASTPSPTPGGTGVTYDSRGFPIVQTALPPAREGAEKKLGEDFGDKDKRAYDMANVTLGSLGQMLHSIETLNATPGGWLNTGAGNIMRGDFAKNVNALAGLMQWNPTFDPNQVANWESLNKNTKLMGMQVINQYFGGQREAATIINSATSAVPNSENTYLGARLVASGIEQAAQRERDMYEYKASLLGQNKSLVTAEADFNKAHPVQTYTQRAIANAVPDGAVAALQQHPELAGQFDAKYGKGLAQFVLGGGRTGLGQAGLAQ